MTDDEWREQLALHAVGALTDEERTDLEDVLRTRPDLEAELEELRAAAGLLADTIPHPPPPELRASVLNAIAVTPQVEPGSPTTASIASSPPADSRPEPPIAPVVPIGAGRRRNRFVMLGAAAAAVVGIVVGVLVVSPWSGGEGDDVAAVIDAADAQRIPMPGPLGELTIVHSASQDAAVLVADTVPVPEGDQVYELWAIRGGTPERYATFRPDADGSLEVYAPGLDPASAEQWAITEEPAGGSDVPTGDILNVT